MAYQPFNYFVIFIAIYFFSGGLALPATTAQNLPKAADDTSSASASVPASDSDSARTKKHVEKIDTLELALREEKIRLTKPNPFANKSVLMLTDEDRLMGNLGDVLERMAGMHIVRTGQVGEYLGVSIHGATNSQVTVYVDGVLKNSGGDPSLSFGDLDLASVEKIEVYKGLAPEFLSGSPMGGAINIVTRKISSNNAAVSVGSFGNYKGDVMLAATRERLRLSGLAVHNQSNGDFTYYDDNGTEFLPGRYPEGAPRKSEKDLLKKVRKNNAHERNEFSSQIEYGATENLKIGVQGSWVTLDKQISTPFANLDSTVTVSAFRESRLVTSRSYALWYLGDFELEGNLSLGFLREVFVDTSKAGGAIGLGYNHERNDYPNLLTSISAKKVYTENISVTSIVSYAVDGYASANRIKSLIYPWLYRYTGEGKLTPTYVVGRNTFQAMVSSSLQLEEEYKGPETVNQGTELAQGGWQNLWAERLAYQFQITDEFSFSLQGGNAYRVPTFFERFGDRGAVLGNPKLKTEKSLNGSVDFHLQRHFISGDFSVFASKGERIITLETNSQSVSIYRNTSDTRILGCELSGRFSAASWSHTDLTLTLQKAENLEGTSLVDHYQLIPYQPLAQTSLLQKWKLGDWSFTQFLYLQGKTVQNRADLPNIFDSYSHNVAWQSRFDLSLTWQFKSQGQGPFSWMISSALRNAFNEQNFDFFNYPLPGRTVAFSTQIGF